MSGKNNFIAKAMCLVMNMDKMVGGQFEQGLAQLKSVANPRIVGRHDQIRRTVFLDAVCPASILQTVVLGASSRSSYR